MAILAQCPICTTRQSLKNKVCKCSQDMDAAKRSKRVKYWLTYRLPGGKQRTELVGYSIEEARDAEGKRRSQKRENRIFDMLPESKMTFAQIADWYLSSKSVQKLASYNDIKSILKKFNSVFGSRQVNTIKPIEIENYQVDRIEKGKAVSTIDKEILYAKAMVIKAFDNDMIGGRPLKAFRKIKKLLKTGSNARDQLVSFEQYTKLIKNAPSHYRPVLTIAIHTGMRMGEIRNLKWSYIDKTDWMIRLPKETVKEGRPKSIPINHHVKTVLSALPHALHHDFVITYMGMPMTGNSSLKKQFPEICRKAKIPNGRKVKDGITFHDIRRTFKTNMVNAGIDKVYRDAILGHKLTGIDAHYIVLTDETLTKAMGQYTRWVDDKLKNVDQEKSGTANVYQNVYQKD